MTESEFRTLCRATSQALDIEEADHLGDTGSLQLHDVDIAVFFHEDVDAQGIHCYFDVGPTRGDRRQEILEDMMTLNYLLGGRDEGVFGIDPSSGHLLLIAHLDPDDFDSGEDLAARLRWHVAQVRSVRESVVEKAMPAFDLGKALQTEFGAPAGTGVLQV